MPLHHTTSHCVAPHRITPHRIASHRTAPHHITLHRTAFCIHCHPLLALPYNLQPFVSSSSLGWDGFWFVSKKSGQAGGGDGSGSIPPALRLPAFLPDQEAAIMTATNDRPAVSRERTFHHYHSFLFSLFSSFLPFFLLACILPPHTATHTRTCARTHMRTHAGADVTANERHHAVSPAVLGRGRAGHKRQQPPRWWW